MEIWVDVKDFEDCYQVSNLGNVKGKDRIIIYSNGREFSYKSKLRKPRLDKYGYYKIALHKNNKTVHKTIHRLVAENFIPNPNNLPQVNHINGIKTDNRLENLEWCTVYENLEHSYNNKLKNIKLSKEDVITIRELYKTNKYTQKEIGNMFNVNKEHINSIVNNRKRVNL